MPSLIWFHFCCIQALLVQIFILDMCIAAGYMSGFVLRNIHYMCMVLYKHKWETLCVEYLYFKGLNLSCLFV